MRIGQGYDAHRLIEGDHLMIGGVKIPYHQGVEAHSDGDVLLHAMGDALLGAAALGDLGQHFPDSDAALANMDSAHLLSKIHGLLREKHFHIANLDATVIAEAPKLAPYIDRMRRKIADILSLKVDQVSIKATTQEKMGWIGRQEGLAAHAVVLLVSDQN